MKNNVILYILIFLAIFITFFIVTLIILKKSRLKKYKNILDELDLEKNLISSIPISLELSKVEPIIKNEDLESKYKKWEDKSDVIKNERIPKIDDMLIDIDTFIEKRDLKIVTIVLPKQNLKYTR